ncbi:MAG: DNA starvation/stationary phase protection protein, partial [Proteobacteria bacterium]
YAEFAKLTTVKEADGTPNATEMVKQLVEGHETVIRTARELIPTTDKAHDEATADLLTQRMQIHEKTAWMLRALLERA